MQKIAPSASDLVGDNRAKRTKRDRRNTQISAAALLGAVFLGVFTEYFSQNDIDEVLHMAEQRKQTLEARYVTEKLLAEIKDEQSSVREFLRTGSEEDLLPFEAARLEQIHDIGVLKNAGVASAPANYQWQTLDELSQQRESMSTRAIAERRTKSSNAGFIQTALEGDKENLKKIQAEIASLETYQLAQVAMFNKRIIELHLETVRKEWVSSLFSGFLIFGAGIALITQRLRRLRLEQIVFDHNLFLEQRVAERTRALAVARDQIQRFAQELNRNIEIERKRISREVHDQLGQVFTALKLILHSIAPGSLEREQQDALDEALRTGIETTRRIAAELRPPLLDDLGFAAATNQYLTNFLRSSKIQVELDIQDDHLLSSAEAVQLFRILQEASTNLVKHAQASTVSIHGAANATSYILTIDDNGVGIDNAKIRQGSLGLINIFERASLIAGNAVVSRRSAGGTRVQIEMPLTKRHMSDTNTSEGDAMLADNHAK